MVTYTDNKDVLDRLKAIQGARVLCIGDLTLDRFVYGQVERISQEAPIPVLKVEREKHMLGAGGNVVANMAGVGVQVTLIALVGDDETANIVRAKLQDIGIDDTTLLVDPKRPTILKTRHVAAGQQLLRTDFEQTQDIDFDLEDQALAIAEKYINKVDAVVITDYGKGLMTERVCRGVIDLARQAGKIVLVDPARRASYAYYRGCNVITPNRDELSYGSGIVAQDDDSVVQASERLMTEFDIGAVIATRSEDGLSIITREDVPVHLKAQAREVYDVSGAGDTVMAVMAGVIASGASLVDAAQIGNIAAGLVVEKVGTAVVTTDEIYIAARSAEKMDSVEQGQGHAYVLPQDRAVEQVERWRVNGLKVGFTNGCFDILHPGHISLLRQARARCDRLVVGLNTDASVKRLKGERRPVNGERARADVLRAIAHVDMVVLFDEDTPLSLIGSIKPDVLVKGADYTLDTVVGADVVQSYGGEVFLAELIEGMSTTGTIEKMAGDIIDVVSGKKRIAND